MAPEREQNTRRIYSANEQGGPDISGKILVVDDTADTRELFHLYLTHAGYTVIEAADGREGLFRAKTDKPDVIVTDIMMPVMDGYAMIREIRGAPEIAATPIIALTAYGE